MAFHSSFLVACCNTPSIKIDLVSNESTKERIHRRDTIPMKPELNPYKGLISLPTQNLKTMNLWVFYFIWCSTFSYILNVRLRLIFGFLIISSSKVNSFHIGTPSSNKNISNHEYPLFTNINLTSR